MLYSILILFLIFNAYSNAQQLIGTHILFRHGERTPTILYPTDPNNPSIWPDGLGQLTIRGKLQHIRLGEYLRQRYSTLLNSTYKASEITIRSSDYDRTLIAAYATLIGLYPTISSNKSTQSLVTSDVWPESLPWQPIPVHTVPRSIDHLMGVSDCDRYTAFVEEMKKSERIQSINKQFQNLFYFLEKNAGQSVPDLFAAWAISDTIVIEDSYNITPSWITPSILSQLHQISDMSAYHLLYLPEINRLRGGPLLRDIMDNIQELILESSKGRKAKIYSGHETTIMALLAFLDVAYSHQPAHAGALFFDLYQQDDSTYAIQLDYLNVTNGRMTHPILLPGCSSAMCPLKTLAPLFEAKLPGNMDTECHIESAKGFTSSHPSCFLLVMISATFHILLYFTSTIYNSL